MTDTLQNLNPYLGVVAINESEPPIDLEKLLEEIQTPQAVPTRRLVMHDEAGVITQIILQAESTLEVLSEKYKEAGIAHVVHDGEADILNSYVFGGEVIAKPEISIVGDVTLKADGMDVLKLMVNPPGCVIRVLLDGKEIHNETLDADTLEFVTTFPGKYIINFVAPHPYKPNSIEIEAV